MPAMSEVAWLVELITGALAGALVGAVAVPKSTTAELMPSGVIATALFRICALTGTVSMLPEAVAAVSVAAGTVTRA